MQFLYQQDIGLVSTSRHLLVGSTSRIFATSRNCRKCLLVGICLLVGCTSRVLLVGSQFVLVDFFFTSRLYQQLNQQATSRKKRSVILILVEPYQQGLLVGSDRFYQQDLLVDSTSRKWDLHVGSSVQTWDLISNVQAWGLVSSGSLCLCGYSRCRTWRIFYPPMNLKFFELIALQLDWAGLGPLGDSAWFLEWFLGWSLGCLWVVSGWSLGGLWVVSG